MGRKRLRYVGGAIEYFAAPEPTTPREPTEDERTQLDGALVRLKARQRDALTMRADGHTFTTIGDTLGIVRQSAQGLVRRAARTARGEGRSVAQCGTLSGYRAHRRRHETTCEACRRAQADHQRLYRLTNRNADETPYR